MDTLDADSAGQISQAWLCGDVVDWQPVARASAFALSTHKDPELKASRLAAFSAVCGMAASLPFGFGFAVIPAGAAFYATAYLSMIFISAAAHSEAFRRLAQAGVKWREQVDELGGAGCSNLIEKIGIPPEHDVVLAMRASRTWALDELKENNINRRLDLNKKPFMGSLCLTAATSWCELLAAGKWARRARLDAMARVNRAEISHHFFPMKIAQIEQTAIKSELAEGTALRSGPKRM